VARYPHKAGVYAIELIASDRIYIGSSTNVPGRWYQHRLHLKNGTHHCPKLQYAWTKYGADAFEWRILEELPRDCSKVEILAREQFYIDSLKPWFNVLPTAGSRLGSLDVEATKRLKSAARRSVTDLVTHCPRGHEYTPENTHLTKRNQRICRECARLRMAAKLATETPAQTSARLTRGRDYHERNREHHLETTAAYVATHKAEKREYDRIHRAEQNARRRTTMTDEKRARNAELQRARRARLKEFV